MTVLSNDLGFVLMRDGPSIYATEINQIPSGTTALYDDVPYGWYHVVYQLIAGWISGTYINVN